MELIKKNILLFSVIGMTVIASLVLAYFIFVERGKMNGLIERTNSLKAKIETLNSQKTAPVQGNLELIESDTQKYVEKVKSIQLLFGQPYYRALKGFGAELGLTPEQLREKFADYCRENIKSTTSYDQIVIKFRRQFKKTKKWDQAWTAFKREVNKVAIDDVEDSTAYSILLFVLGLPREMSILKADKFREEYRNKIFDKLEKANVSCDYKTTAFSIDYSKLPYKSAIPLMVHNLTIIGDLIVKRLIPSGIIRIEDFKIRRMEPEDNGDYQSFRYSLTVIGTLANVRKFINKLSRAYDESRVYVVRGIEISKVTDQAKQILDKAAGLQDYKRKRQNGEDGPGGRSGDIAMNDMEMNEHESQPDMDDDGFSSEGIYNGRGGRVIKEKDSKRAEREKARKAREAKIQAALPYYKRKVYNKSIIGANKLCKAVIDIDYVRYKANDINLD